jgi:hypothetical protein
VFEVLFHIVTEQGKLPGENYEILFSLRMHLRVKCFSLRNIKFKKKKLIIIMHKFQSLVDISKIYVTHV